MKTIIFSLFGLFFSVIIQAQVSKTVNVTAGNLKTILTAEELTTVTNLTITGKIDARDFKTMRDDMTVLAVLDLSGVTVASYYGTDGTGGEYETSYPANAIPYAAFIDIKTEIGKTSLTSILLPLTITSVGIGAFYKCSGLTSVSIPSSVTTFGNYAFADCSKLTAITLSSGVSVIGNGAFLGCSGLITVDAINPDFSSLDGALYNKTLTNLMHCPTSKTGSFVIPASVSSIEDGAFYGCSALTSLSIPASVTSFGNITFYGCSGLTTIYSKSGFPIELNPYEDVFSGVNKVTCTLYVPFGTKGLYAKANGWGEFKNITEEKDGFHVGTSLVKVASGKGSNVTVNITANVSWTASSDQNWLKADPTSGTNNQTITITAESNESELSRSAKITFSATGFSSQILTVIQDGLNKTIKVKAGGLLSALTGAELNGISNLKLTGVIDARDFKMLRDTMPNLSVLDLTDVIVSEYSGTDGTSGYYSTYPANAIPSSAFFNTLTEKGKSSLTSVLVPVSVTSIQYNAFHGCSNITSMTIPTSVTSIGYGAFADCTGLLTFNIPSSVSMIENGAFTNSGIMLTVDAGNLYFSSLDGVLFNKDRTSLIYCPTSKTGNYNIPSSVVNIDYGAFQSCKSLTSISIPSSVTFLSASAFNNCTGLISVDANNQNYSGIDGVLFNKNATTLIKCPVSKTGSYVIPAMVTTIGEQAFYYCNQLTSVTIPISVTSIANGAFGYCTGLTSIIAHSSYPVKIEQYAYIFEHVNQSTCTLNVPYEAKKFYAAAEQWKDFTNIVEQPNGFIVSPSNLYIASEAGNNASANVSANVAWTASSNQTWLAVNPVSGAVNSTLTFTAQENKSLSIRTAIVTISANGYPSQTISINQSGVVKKINIEAGSLLSGLNANEISQISKLTITGTMDARDFKILRDNMPSLADLDLSGVTVVAYSGTEGTYYTNEYPANSIPQYAFYNMNVYPPKSNLTSVILPNSINSIGEFAFSYCKGLTSITIPQSVSSIGNAVFNYCSGLTSIVAESSYPADLTSVYSVFGGVDKTVCTLNVPYQSKKLYAAAAQWKDFTNIIEAVQGFMINPISHNLTAEAGSHSSANVTANVSWTAASNQTWLTVNPTSGTGDKTLSFTAEANNSVVTRTAKVTVSANDVTSQNITINQEGQPKKINITAGGLLTGLTNEELNGITNLTITGTIDARDFKTMRDDMPYLAVLDISGAKVVAYSGMEGTTYQTEYPANTVPENAFYNQNTNKGKTSLTSVVLPTTLKRIGTLSFQNCSGLTSIIIPSGVSEFGSYAFSGCSSLTSVDLPSSINLIQVGVFNNCKSLTTVSIPSSVILIGNNAFTGCTGLTTVNLPSSLVNIWDYAFEGCSSLTAINLPNSIKSIGEGVFQGCSSLTSIVIPPLVTSIANSTFQLCTDLTSVTIPSSVTSIGVGAFAFCSGLTSVTIPVSVTSIGSNAFAYCTKLSSIFANSSHPVNLTSSPGVFSGVDKTTCALNVPYKAKDIYATADQWKDFIKAIESTQGFLLDSAIVRFSVTGGSAVVNSTANVVWTSSSDQTWLTLKPMSGTGIQPITFTAEENKTVIRRTSKVTFSATNVLSQIVTIIQEGRPDTINIEPGGLLSGLTAAELNGVTNLKIKGTMDARDFKTIRDKMPMLEVLDLSDITILAYSGAEGTSYQFDYPANTIPESAFFYSNSGKGKTSLTSVILPSSIASIGNYAFNGCTGLTNINLPASVNSIGYFAFANCSGLTSIYVNSGVPVDLNSSWSVFEGINKTSCILNVPFGSKDKYASAYQWKDFTNIIEAKSGFITDPKIVNISATAGSTGNASITGNVAWTTSCDKTWLIVKPASGTGDNVLTFTAEANRLQTSRKAQVTVSAKDFPSQTITVIQDASTDPLPVTAGKLKTLFTSDELNSITKLKLSGTIDARDFKSMRDDMPLLADIDLNDVTIAQYTGAEGPWFEVGKVITYPANEIPGYAFKNGVFFKPSLMSFIFPKNTKSVGYNAFDGGFNLTSIVIPPTVTKIYDVAFAGCRFSKVIIPSSVTSIGVFAFSGSNYIEVEADNPNYCSVDGILFNKAKTTIMQCPYSKTGSYFIPLTVSKIDDHAFEYCRDLTSINIPSSVKIIGPFAFLACINLNTMTIPSSVTTIGREAFTDCTGLTSIYCNTKIPVDLSNSDEVFRNVNKTTCTLYVPNGTKDLYKAAVQWKDFQNIVEISFIEILSTDVRIADVAGSKAEVKISSNVSWTAKSNQSWLTVNPASGKDNQILTLTAGANTMHAFRKAQVIIHPAELDSQIIFVLQEESKASLNITAGGLKDKLTTFELGVNSKLTLTGTIDARDFKTMRDDMPNLREIDLSGATIVEYTGTEGTWWDSTILTLYPANTIPDFAFYNAVTNIGNTNLTSFIFPAKLTAIGDGAFNGSYNLLSIIIPSSVTKIGNSAFFSCFQSTSVTIPQSVMSIGQLAFARCKYINVDKDNAYYSSADGILFNKTFTKLLQFPPSKTGHYEIPSSVTSIESDAFNLSSLTSVNIPLSVTSIGSGAFFNCHSLNTISIPSSVTNIGNGAFWYSSGLTSIIAYSSNPVDLTSSNEVFTGVNQNICSLKVPFGSKALYAAANQWKDFANILEMPGLILSANALTLTKGEGSTATLNVTSNIDWKVNCDQLWLSIDSTAGTGNKTIAFTAKANSDYKERIATVSVSGNGIETQTIIVTQNGISVGVNDISENNTHFNCYPNPFVEQITIEIRNPKRTDITVDIYNIMGERIKNLVNGISDEKIDVIWNGTNDKGQKVATGVYLCKMNNLSKKLVFGVNSGE